MKLTLTPGDWDLEKGPMGELTIHGLAATDLAARFGTPLHVVDLARLERVARGAADQLRSPYPGKSAVHYAFKCNAAPGILEVIRRAGLHAEVCTEQELQLALRCGFDGSEIIVNGPAKSIRFLEECLAAEARLIIVDALEELDQLARICAASGRRADILLRINPDVAPKGLNGGSATGSRKGCAFGLDLAGGEAHAALERLREMSGVRFRGFHFHIGTGIADPGAYVRAIGRIAPLAAFARSRGFAVDILDVGGGIASPTARELTSFEMALYQVLHRFPERFRRARMLPVRAFGEAIAGAVARNFQGQPLPELLLEPGRCVASSSQFLLLTILRVKERSALPCWIVADGGIGTVALPSYYEYHELFLCNDTRRPRARRATIVGPCCFAGDVLYRNRRFPAARPGEVIALMDSGAYFTQLESSFGMPRPAIAGVDAAGARCLRRRESFDEMNERDIDFTPAMKGA